MSSQSNLMENDDTLGLFVEYDDDIDECIKQPMKQKSRVRYNCFHAYGSFLAFGSSSGAIYLFKLEAITHSTCSLITIVPCDQGSIEVVQFSPYSSADYLLVAIGTARGSLIVFKLTLLSSENDLITEEIYRAESFTSSPIQLIEHDIETTAISRIYLCDANNHIYLVDNFMEPRISQLFYKKAPTLLLKIDDSKVNQMHIFRSQLVISTSKSTIIFDADTNEFKPVGKKKRKDEGFYGGCFFINPTRGNDLSSQQRQHNTIRTNIFDNTNLDNGDSMTSLADIVTIYTARPSFRMWQVNLDGSVLLTHQFESTIKSAFVTNIVQLKNCPLKEGHLDDPSDIVFNLVQRKRMTPSSDHFQKLTQLNSSTLGSCIITHTNDEIFVLDPNGAKLIAWNTQDLTNIRQLCCVDNEIFILCDLATISTSTAHNGDGRLIHTNEPTANNNPSKRKNINFTLRRLALLAPTQFVLELHRLRRYESLIVFVESYISLFKKKMAIPLGGDHIITTEGGLLRNVLLNAWTIFDENKKDNHGVFGSIIELILDEGRQMQQVDTFVSNLSLFSSPSTENIYRLRQEPYASLISLNVSIADLHTSHVIHFSKEVIDRHKSSTNQLRQDNCSITNLNSPFNNRQFVADKVIVERRRPRRSKSQQKINEIEEPSRSDSVSYIHVSDTHDESSGTLNKFASHDCLHKTTKTADIEVDVECNKQALASTRFHDMSYIPSEHANSRQKRTLLKQIPETTDETNNRNDSYQDIFTSKHLSTSYYPKNYISSNSLPGLYIDNIATSIQLSSRYCCKICGWPLPNAHENLHPSQIVLDNWINETLLDDLETNVEYVEDLAFTNCLWATYLKCLIHRRKCEDYVKCSIMLNDIRLLKSECITTYMSSESSIMTVLEMLLKKYDAIKAGSNETTDTGHDRLLCQNCQTNLDLDNNKINNDSTFGITLVNIAEIAMNCLGPKATVDILLNVKFKSLIDKSEIPASFYIKSIKAAVLSAHQSPISRTKLEMLRGSVDENFDDASQQQYI